ncbi:MAG: DNA cytosine methyltransferase [Desulfuromonadales bacterium]|nr:DNA cytosine methyltransferase [Desulfuromonadales bacterium]
MKAYKGTYRIHPQIRLNFEEEIAVDSFAGGGGASTGIEAGLGRPVDLAINHDPGAIAMHTVNHPHTRHFCESVWKVDPKEACGGRKVGLMWLSPDCTHFSKAKGGKPRKKQIRGLAWVGLKWAGLVRPRVIILENVEEFQTWGPLKKGQPCPKRKGETFEKWKAQLENLGYRVEHRELRACDYGAPTTRKRLFVVARCDGAPIVWPEPTHGPGLKPYRTAAEIIDWSIPCPSIFTRKRPLAENTLKRIARGIQKFVLENPEPFIVTYYGAKKGEHFRGHGMGEPLRTQTTENRFALVTPFLAKHFGGNYSGAGIPMDRPADTVTARDHHSLVSASLIRHFGKSIGSGSDDPVPTITAGGSGKTGLVTSHLLKLRGTCRHGQKVDEPMPTVTAGGMHIGEVRAFLLKYYGTEQDPRLEDPLHTITGKHRFGLVTVHGEPYQIIDIGMRMLTPRELYRAQGFPENYIIDRRADGSRITATDQVKYCGNSVPPVFAEALVRANLTDAAQMAEAS